MPREPLEPIGLSHWMFYSESGRGELSSPPHRHSECPICHTQLPLNAPMGPLKPVSSAWRTAAGAKPPEGAFYVLGQFEPPREPLAKEPHEHLIPSWRRRFHAGLPTGAILVEEGEPGAPDAGNDSPESSVNEQLEAIRAALEKSRSLGRNAQRGIDALRERSS